MKNRYEYIVADCKAKTKITHKTLLQAYKDYISRSNKNNLGILKYDKKTDLCTQIG